MRPNTIRHRAGRNSVLFFLSFFYPSVYRLYTGSVFCSKRGTDYFVEISMGQIRTSGGYWQTNMKSSDWFIFIYTDSKSIKK